MTQEEKQLLLKDLSARLPYEIKIQVKEEWATLDTELKVGHINRLQNDDIELKPYLRSISSMTEEERKEYEGFIIHRDHIYAQGQEWDIDCFSFGSVSRLIDWLNVHHFDYRGLIDKGLAIEVTKENNPYKD